MKNGKIWKLLTMLCIMMMVIGVSIVSVQAAGTKINNKTKTIRVGKYYHLELKNAKGKVKWKSSNKSVAIVDSKGYVRGIREGKATITATCNGKKYKCKVTVKPMKESADSSRKQFITFAEWTVDGQEIDNFIFPEAKITMINFFEPWCGPCRREIPDIDKLYQDYKDKGFNVIGVFGDQSYDGASVVKEFGMSYPVIHSSNLAAYNRSGSFPATIFVDDMGYLIYPEMIIGSSTYDVWYEFIKDYLEK